MYYLFTCDWLTALEGGVDKLTDKDVIEVWQGYSYIDMCIHRIKKLRT